VGLDPKGMEGLSADLLAVLAEHGMDALPEACRHSRCGDRFHQFLERQATWQTLVEEVAALPATGRTGTNLVPYSLRHAYADRASRVGLTDKEAALMCGHSLQTHHAHYSGTTTETAARALAKAKAANTKVEELV